MVTKNKTITSSTRLPVCSAVYFKSNNSKKLVNTGLYHFLKSAYKHEGFPNDNHSYILAHWGSDDNKLKIDTFRTDTGRAELGHKILHEFKSKEMLLVKWFNSETYKPEIPIYTLNDNIFHSKYIMIPLSLDVNNAYQIRTIQKAFMYNVPSEIKCSGDLVQCDSFLRDFALNNEGITNTLLTDGRVEAVIIESDKESGDEFVHFISNDNTMFAENDNKFLKIIREYSLASKKTDKGFGGKILTIDRGIGEPFIHDISLSSKFSSAHNIKSQELTFAKNYNDFKPERILTGNDLLYKLASAEQEEEYDKFSRTRNYSPMREVKDDLKEKVIRLNFKD